MTMQDPISDMLTRIRNAQAVAKPTVSIPASTLKISIVEVLEKEGYVAGFETNEDENGFKNIIVTLKYHNGSPVITAIKRISSPGVRVYQRCKELKEVVGGLGIAIISTSKGLMTDHAARRAKLGGEVICYVW